jgi:predicted Zn-dependent protease
MIAGRARIALLLIVVGGVHLGCGAQLATSGGEARVGAEAAAEVEKAVGLVDAPSLETYLGAVGARVAMSPSVRQGIAYRFRVVDMAEPNAFALPGGYVYVSRGLLVLLNDEDELANVLAHEVAHVSARHHLKHALGQTPFVPVRLATGIARAALDLATLPFGALGAPVRTGGAAVGALGNAPGALLLASHSRSEEDEADEIGQQLVAEAGWDPAGMARVMESLERDIRRRGGDPNQRSFLSTHPSPPDRAERTAQRARTLQTADVPPIARDRARFYQMLDGLLVGDPASYGFVDGRNFLHADLDFAIAFPDGWKIENGAENVSAIPSDDPRGEGAFAVVSLAGRGSDPEAVARELLAKSALEHGELTVGKVGALPAARVEGRDDSGRIAYRWIGHWIAHHEVVFQVVAAAPADQWARYEPSLAAVARSFRPLVDRDHGRIHDARLRVVSAHRSESLGALVGRRDAAWDVAAAAAANALSEQAVLAADQPVKLAEWEAYQRRSREPEPRAD